MWAKKKCTYSILNVEFIQTYYFIPINYWFFKLGIIKRLIKNLYIPILYIRLLKNFNIYRCFFLQIDRNRYRWNRNTWISRRVWQTNVNHNIQKFWKLERTKIEIKTGYGISKWPIHTNYKLSRKFKTQIKYNNWIIYSVKWEEGGGIYLSTLGRCGRARVVD